MAAPNPALRSFTITVTLASWTRFCPLLSITITSKSRKVCARSESRQAASASSAANVGMAMVTFATLVAGPAGHAFFQERGNPLLRVLSQRIHGHHFFGVSVGFGLIEIDLRIKRLFTQSHRKATGVGDVAGQPARFRFQFRGRNGAIDEPPVASCGGIHGLAAQ